MSSEGCTARRNPKRAKKDRKSSAMPMKIAAKAPISP
jgi:hypothetical protein